MMDTVTKMPIDQDLYPDGLHAVAPIGPAWLVGFGILLVALGTLAFLSIVTATIVSVYFVAIAMVVAGVADITLGLRSGSSRRTWTWVLLGILYVGAGLFAFFNPLLAAGVFTLLLGASLLAAGIVRLFLSFQMRSNSEWWWMAVSAAVTALLGIMVISQWPASSLTVLGVFLSVDLIFAGLGWTTIGMAAMALSHPTASAKP
jgi:uncharacterized membrane protein HdeD (DUF308 family)